MSKYEFVTDKDAAAILAQFQQGKRSLYSVSVLVHRLLRERDAYREVAAREWRTGRSWYDEERSRAEVDTKALRILTPKDSLKKDGGKA